MRELTCVDCSASFAYKGGRPAERCLECRRSRNRALTSAYNATPEYREIRRARQRERYATDADFREKTLARQRERDLTPEARAAKLARKKRWIAENRERYLEQTRRHHERRRQRPEARADAVKRTRRWREENPERHRDLRYKKYGITAELYDEMLARQAGVCAICNRPETSRRQGVIRALAVDHCHATGRVRALLCQRCNHTLGRMYDDPKLLRRAAGYLEAYA